MTCNELTDQIKLITQKKRDFEVALGQEKPDIKRSWALHQEIKQIIKEIQEKLGGEIVEKLNLREQYKSQIQILERVGVLQELSDGTKGIIGIDGQEYPVPSLEEIVARITPEQAELLAQKKEQGFSKLLLVPFGLKLEDLIGKYRDLLLKKDFEGTLLATDGSKLALNRTDPVHDWTDWSGSDTNGNLVYDPQSFDANHQGKTKQELIQVGSPWRIKLIEDLSDLPGQGDGQIVGGRPQLEAHQTPKDYLDTLKNDPAYAGEKGLDPETWLTYALTSLEEGKGQIDDWLGKGKGSFLTGAYFADFDEVPDANLDRGRRQAFLHRHLPSSSFSSVGCRSAVEIQ